MGYANAIEATWRPAYGMNVPRASPRYTPTPPAAPGHDTASASRMTSAADPQGLAALLARMADGDESALAAFYDATVAKAYGFALRIVGTPAAAEEVVVDTYHQAWREARRFDAQRGAPLAFLMMMCRSRALDALRGRDHAMTHEDPASLIDDSDHPCGGSPLDLLAAVEARSALHGALALLAPAQRQMVALAFFRGMTPRGNRRARGAAAGHGQKPDSARTRHAAPDARDRRGSHSMNDKRNAARIPALAPELAGELAAELAIPGAPATLAPERQALILERLLSRVHGDAQRFVTVRRDDGVWQSLAPDISMKILDSDRSMQAYLLRLAPGACLPGHPHPDDEMCYVLEGDATLGDITVGPGDYHLARAGSAHGDVTTRTGCLLLIRSGSGVATHRQALHGA